MQGISVLLLFFNNFLKWLFIHSNFLKESLTTAHGDSLDSAINKLLSIIPNQIISVGVNCSSPSCVQPFLQSLTSVDKPFVVYSNSGEKYINGELVNKKFVSFFFVYFFK